MRTYRDLTAEELQALQDYAKTQGRNWKAQLVEDWMSDHRRQWGTLRVIRNTFGPSWLNNFKMRPTAEIAAMLPKTAHCERCGSPKPVGQSCGCFDNASE